jgi:hypothetical protein
VLKQYLFSMYWMASTLSTASLVGATTPKSQTEITFTIWSTLTTLTVYAYVVGEISNTVMAKDQALVHMREEISRVQMFISKHKFPRDLATDIVSTFYDRLHANKVAEQVTDLLSSNLRVEVAMQLSLPLLKANKLLSSCSTGFTANMSVLFREVSLASDEIIFRGNDICNDLYLIAISTVTLFLHTSDGGDKVRRNMDWIYLSHWIYSPQTWIGFIRQVGHRGWKVPVCLENCTGSSMTEACIRWYT